VVCQTEDFCRHSKLFGQVVYRRVKGEEKVGRVDAGADPAVGAPEYFDPVLRAPQRACHPVGPGPPARAGSFAARPRRARAPDGVPNRPVLFRGVAGGHSHDPGAKVPL